MIVTCVAVERIIGEGNNTGLFQYFIRVVPTIYTNEYGGKIYTNQYTVTDRFRPLAVPTFDASGPMEKVIILLSCVNSLAVSCADCCSHSLARRSCPEYSSCTSCRPS